MAINREVFISFYAILICLGVPGNSLILAGYSRKKIKNGTDIFIMGLAAVDLFSSFFIIAKFRPWVETNSYCQFQFFFTGWIALAQMTTTLAISIDRFFAVCRPIHRRPKVRTAIGIMIVCLLVPFLLNAPSLTATRYEPAIKDCLYRQDLKWFTVYDQYVFQTVIIALLFIVTLVYTRIVFALRRQTKVRTALTAAEPSHLRTGVEDNTATASGNPGQSASGSDMLVDPKQVGPVVKKDTNSLDRDHLGQPVSVSDDRPIVTHNEPHSTNRTVVIATQPSAPIGNISAGKNPSTTAPVETAAAGRQLENRLTLMLGWVTAFYVVSWLPAIIGRYLPVETRRAFMSRSDTHHTVYAIFFRMYEVNTAINFFIYWPLNRRFRQNCKDIFIKIKHFIMKETD